MEIIHGRMASVLMLEDRNWNKALEEWSSNCL